MAFSRDNTLAMTNIRRLGTAMAVLCLTISQTGFSEALKNGSREAGPFFTEPQAKRGKDLFDQNCSGCHSIGDQGQPTVTLVGDAFLRRWRTVGDLYSLVRETMPASKVRILSEAQCVEVIAYLLRSNGIPSGSRPLTTDRAMLSAMVMAPYGPANPSTPISRQADKSQGYFTQAQAERGRHFFEGACAMCHVDSAKREPGGVVTEPLFANVSMVADRSIAVGSLHMKTHLVYPEFFDQWDSVGALFRRVKFTMPEYSPGGLSNKTYADIVAYLMKTNGLASGPTELPADEGKLDNIPLLRQGFSSLFNGHDLTGFRFLIGMGCKPAPDGCGSNDARDVFSVKDGVISTRGYPAGYMYTEGKYLNFTFRFQYRFVPPPGARREEPYWGNTGYMLFITDNYVWPKSIEIQGLDPIQLRPLGLDSNPTYTYDRAAMQHARRPTGEWNTVEIHSSDGQVRSSLNGVLVSVVSQHEFTKPGYIGFQAEDAQVEWRNLQIKEY
jgi:cytochrome c5